MGDVFVRPNFDGGPYSAERVMILAGTELIRIFNHEYELNSYNPTLAVPDNPGTRGRFTGTEADPYASMYCAQPPTLDDVRAVLLEKFDERDLLHNPQGTLRFIPRALAEGLSFGFLRVVVDIPAIRLCTEPEARAVGANQYTLRSDDHELTREWARYLRKRDGDLKGVYFVPRRFGDSEAGYALVLFDDRYPGEDGLVEIEDRPRVPLVSGEGRALIRLWNRQLGIVPYW